MQENEFYNKLVNRYAENLATGEELEVFFQLLNEGKLDKHVTKKMIEEISNQKEGVLSPVRRIFKWTRIAAASVVLIVAVGLFYFINQKPAEMLADKVSDIPQLINDAEPGGNRAVLTLADGSTIILDSADNGMLSQQGNIQIIKLDDGQLSYTDGKGKNSNKILYNTITTPKGGQYQLTLSDGSQVWLNAESSIRFPASFTGNKRDVEMTGEGYFEIVHNSAKPFVVNTDGLKIEVLGTQFNVNTYGDEDVMKTTLLEGSVKVLKGSQNVIIEPGQQVILNELSNSLTVNNAVNLEEVIAWKNGLFQFEKTEIKNVMKQIGRWYDIEVEFEKDLPQKRFTGKIRRNMNASEVFKILELLDVQFKLEGKKVLVTK